MDLLTLLANSLYNALFTEHQGLNNSMSKLAPSIKLIQEVQPQLLINNAAASARISLFGGQVLSFIPRHDGRERLWLSNKAVWDGSQSLRGGVPVCWPWFGQHPDGQHPAHGFVRNRLWQCLESSDTENSSSLILSPTDSQGAGFDGLASLTLSITVGSELNIKLITTNLGTRSFIYTCALHSYFNVQDISEVELDGLSGKYADKLSGFKLFDTPNPYRFTTETDRIHLNPHRKVSIIEKGLKTVVNSEGHDSIVVWNPWQQNSIQLNDMDNDGYKYMLCVETAVTKGKSIKPGDQHVIEQTIN
tara:strand:+ start:523 stop:1434 length:912 start_codon:yes stop_codon:yes gene_type:complete